MRLLNKSFIWLCLLLVLGLDASASSHREAPLIANDPLADNTDLYAFRSPDDPNTITIIANYIPMQLPHGGPNYYWFGKDVRYEIHIDNDASKPGDEIIYRFTFDVVNEDPTTFFNIRLGAQNVKNTYTLERSMDGGMSFETIVTNGFVPPNNIGPRSIESPVGLGTTYAELMQQAITTTASGEKVFAGPTDDPFFVDLGGIFDLGDSPRQNGRSQDGLACYNVHSIAIQVPIQTLLKEGASSTPANILDPDYVIGVWASASRQQIRTLTPTGSETDGDWVQVSRIGMPLTNEVVIAIGDKDYWNALTPYQEITDQILDPYFYNPELALYMDEDNFAAAVPAFDLLRIQTNSLGAFDFSNGADGLFGLKGSDAVEGTALDDDVFGSLLLPGPGQPRSVDLWPIFHTGVPNVIPYQLATGKGGNPLAAGKPFINNFLPNGGDMLRLNMAVPVTPRDSEAFSPLGIVAAAVAGLTDPTYASTDLEFIPNMDGFPNGRRLEDDVTRIELQAVAGVALAAIGLWYDDFDPNNSPSPVTQDLLNVLTYTTEVEENDKPFRGRFPYLAAPFSGTGPCSGPLADPASDKVDLEVAIRSDLNDYQQYIKVPYEITVTNNGEVDADGVSLAIALPDGMVFASASASSGGYDLFNESWNVGKLSVGESATLTLVLFTLVDGPDLTLFAQVASASPLDIDSTPGNDDDNTPDEDDEAALTLSPGDGGGNLDKGDADLSLTLEADPTYSIYEPVTYTATLTNDGPDNATNVTVRIGLIDGLVFTSASATEGAYNLFREEWTVGAIPAGSSETLTLTLFSLTENEDLTNYAEVFASDQQDPDSNAGNGTFGTASEDDEAVVTITSFTGPGSQNRASGPSAQLDRIFPVPALTTLNVHANATVDQATSLEIYNMSGQRVQAQAIRLVNGLNTFELDVSQLAAGAYLIFIPLEEGGAIQEKFMKSSY